MAVQMTAAKSNNRNTSNETNPIVSGKWSLLALYNAAKTVF